MQKELIEGLVRERKPIRDGMKNLPKAITFPQLPSITANSDDGEEGDAIIEDIAEQYFRKITSESGIDKTRIVLRDKDDKFYIGNKETKIKENNIIDGCKVYVGTPRLWELYSDNNFR